MQKRADLLLVELHAHSTWSDGCLSIRALVDLYGWHEFDVLCITDHVHPPDDPWARLGVPAERFGEYVAEIEREAERARERYGLLVVPGSELTVNHSDPDLAAHAVAVGLRSYISLAEGLDRGLSAARDAGAALVAAHPSGAAAPGGTVRRDAALLAGAGCTRRARRPFRADQWTPRLRLGGRGPAAGRRGRRLPPDRASRRLEDAHALRKRRAASRRLPSLRGEATPHAVQPAGRARPPRRLTLLCVTRP
jgi:hypothetical protein